MLVFFLSYELNEYFNFSKRYTVSIFCVIVLRLILPSELANLSDRHYGSGARNIQEVKKRIQQTLAFSTKNILQNIIPCVICHLSQKVDRL